MTTGLKIDAKHTAVISLHLQKSTVHLTGVPDEMMDRVDAVLKGARRAGILVVHQVTGFRKGYPEVSPRNKTLMNLSTTGVLQPGMEGGELHAKAAALPEDIIVGGPRFGAFFENDMGSVLRAKDITALVLLGVSSGGAVMTAVTSATDLDFELVMIEDCCLDTDPELHRVLFERLFPRRADILSTQEFLQVIGSA